VDSVAGRGYTAFRWAASVPAGANHVGEVQAGMSYRPAALDATTTQKSPTGEHAALRADGLTGGTNGSYDQAFDATSGKCCGSPPTALAFLDATDHFLDSTAKKYLGRPPGWGSIRAECRELSPEMFTGEYPEGTGRRSGLACSRWRGSAYVYCMACFGTTIIPIA